MRTPALTDGAAQTLPLLSPFGVAQNVNDKRGELPGIETGQLLTALRAEKGVVYSLGSDYVDISHSITRFHLVNVCVTMNTASSLPSVSLAFKSTFSKLKGKQDFRFRWFTDF